jgi:hypothetical protein
MGLTGSTPKSLGPLPVWAVTNLIQHPVQDLLHKRLTTEPGVFLFWGAWGSGKHHYMLQAAREMREKCSHRDVHWVSCGSHTYREPLIPWLAKMILKDEIPVQTEKDLIDVLPKDRAATIFLHHSEILLINSKTHQQEYIDNRALTIKFLDNLAEAIKLSGRGDVNVIFANSRPENARAVLESNHIQLLGPPDCSRWKEEHVRAFVDQRLWSDSKWTAEDKEVLVKLGTTIGAVAFIDMWILDSFPKTLSEKQKYAEKLGERWNALKSEGVMCSPPK